MSFGQQLKKARKNKGLSQLQLAQMVNRSKSTITSWECDDRQPTMPMIKTLASVLDVSAEYLLEIKTAPTDEGEGDPKNERIINVMEELRAFLVRCGFLRSGEDLTKDQAEALLVLLQALFK